LFLTRAKQRNGDQHRKDEKFLHISSEVGLTLNEENGALPDVKQNLVRPRPGRGQTCPSCDDYFRVAAPKTLDVAEHSEHRQTNRYHQHQEHGDFGNSALSILFRR
jgi:hypothetical protein